MKQVKIVLILSIVVILIASFTVGRQIYENRQPDLLSFSIIHFSGYLFFLLMPVELLFIYNIVEGANIPMLFALAMATALVAEFADYLIGYTISTRMLNTLTNKKNKKMQKHIKTYGNTAIFFFNALPLSSPILSLAAGMLKYKPFQFFLYSFLGLFLKYFTISLLFVKS